MRKRIQILLTAIFIVIVSAGWKFSVLGLLVPVVMFMGMVIGPFKGRWVCANACPRGSFLDTIMVKTQYKGRFPGYFRNKFFKFSIVAILMGLMIFRLSVNVRTVSAAGVLFWQMCFATSVVAIVLALIYSHRAWCAICPMGTIQTVLHSLKKNN